jgi:hypothetical protein
MKKIAAQYVFFGSDKLEPKQVVCLDDNDCVFSIQPLKEEIASTIFLNGVLCPAFGLPGNDKVLTTEDATSLLKRVRETYPLLTISEILTFYTSSPDLKVGSKVALWCIEAVDLKNLLPYEDVMVYSVFP